MNSFKEFISVENLRSMDSQDLIKLWAFLLSDAEVIQLIETIKEILDVRHAKGDK